MCQFALGLRTTEYFLQRKTFTGGDWRAVAYQHIVVKAECIVFVMREDFGCSFNTLASYFVDDVPRHRHGRCFVHTANLGNDSSESHGRHLERAS